MVNAGGSLSCWSWSMRKLFRSRGGVWAGEGWRQTQPGSQLSKRSCWGLGVSPWTAPEGPPSGVWQIFVFIVSELHHVWKLIDKATSPLYLPRIHPQLSKNLCLGGLRFLSWHIRDCTFPSETISEVRMRTPFLTLNSRCPRIGVHLCPLTGWCCRNTFQFWR